MNWKKINKDKSKQPKEGTYLDWKEQIAEECYFKCIYCSIHESQFGGIDHYHVEHYRPKSIQRFKKYENDIMNLFYACPICNRFKSNDWPNDPKDLNIICYPNPSHYDYSSLFDVDEKTYKVIGKYLSTIYMTERLYLNRPQLIYERREEFLRFRKEKVLLEIEELEKKDFSNINDLNRKLIDLTIEIIKLLNRRSKIRPYRLKEIRK